MSQSDTQGESLLDRIGPALVWIGLVVVMVVASGVLIHAQRGFGSRPIPDTMEHASHSSHGEGH